MSRAKKLGIDLDGCLVNWCGEIARRFRVEGCEGVPDFTRSEPPVWDWFPTYAVPKQVVHKVMQDTHREPSFWRSLAPHYTCSERLWQRLRMMEMNGDTLYFLTNRGGWNVHAQTANWLKDVVGLKNPTVLICPTDKSPIVNSLQLDMVLDDRPEQITSYCENTTAAVYHILRPYNLNAKVGARSPVLVDTVEEALTHFDDQQNRLPKAV